MSREIMQQALDALTLECCDNDGNPVDLKQPAIAALEQELAKPEQTETLRVADAIELNVATKADRLFAAKELRRLHDENETLKKCLFQMQNAAIELAKPEECVCCGDYEKCIKPCTPKGRWLAEKEFTKEEQLSPVGIGVDVTPEGTHVVAVYRRSDAVEEMFYSRFHPLTKSEQSNSIWVLTREINQYDQDGEYFVGAWNQKPTHQMLTELGVPQNRLRKVLDGGGRVYPEEEWFYLKELNT
jgi:hypothetical protein